MRLLLMAGLAAAAGPGWIEDLPRGLAEAKRTARPLLVDFTASWCYSCYYMDQHVLGRPRFAEAAKGLVLARVDVDKPEGHAVKGTRGVRFLPSYLLLSADGNELGRIVGEQTEDDFHARLTALLAPVSPAVRAVSALRSALGAGDERAIAQAARAPTGLERQLAEDREWRLLTAKARLAGEKPKEGAEQALEALIEQNDGCDLPDDLDALEKLKDRVPPARLAELRDKGLAALERLLERRVLAGPGAAACADLRGAVSMAAELYEQAGRKDKRDALLKRALAFLDGKGLKPGEDRNHDDNLRVFLKMAGEDERLQGFYERLIAAYPADYVYAQRYARFLADKGLHREALPWIEKADRLAYGANRLFVTEVRAKILAGLGRREEALKLLTRDIKAGRRAFPKYVASLEKLQAELGR